MIDPDLLEKLKIQHLSVFDEIITKNQYHVSEPDLKGKVILDIGANTGIFTVLANDYGAKSIIAIESNPASFKILSDNVKDFNNVTVINKAASSISNKKVRIGKESFYADIDGRCYVVPTESGNIDTISINDILSKIEGESIILKIDCEGSEYDILYSIDQKNFDKIYEILLEAHDGIGPAPKIIGIIDKLADYIKGRGFKIVSRYSVVGTIVQMFKFERDTVNVTTFNKELFTDITCVVSTKDRYFSTLPLTLIAICNQTHMPKRLLIYDDSKNKKDLRNEFIYTHIFSLLSFYGIAWEVIFSNEEGQVANHIKSLAKSETDWIYRCDDDEIPEPTVLEKLLKNIKPDVGAVGGLIIPSNNIKPLPSIASNKIEDIYLLLNEQWYAHPDNSPVKEVDHLYSSFIYRKSIAEYCSDLSVVGHREESILTYSIKKKGYKILIDPSARTWHLRNPEGGIRSDKDINDFARDEHVFQKKMISWGVKANEYKFVVLENGIGDHFAFKSILPEFLKKYSNEKKVFCTTYPIVFEDIPDIKQASIADAKISFDSTDKYGIYKWMIDHNWQESIVKAYAKMYNVEVPSKKAETNAISVDSTIIISPYSFIPSHAKSYPFWKELIPKIKTLGHKLVQIGVKGEIPLEGMDDYWWSLSFRDLEEKIKMCTCWISVDNFLQHMVNCMDTPIKGIVFWGVSDPNIFGYDYNTNILKDRKYLRPDQFGTWKEIKPNGAYMPQNKDAFVKPDEAFKIIGRIIGNYK